MATVILVDSKCDDDRLAAGPSVELLIPPPVTF